jgi:predicted RNA-binding Zn-ribbon protein involved in translation (DUF1610 family)
MNKRTINAAIKHLGIEIQHERGAGYFYFTSIETGVTVGESVMVCYYNQLTLDQWVKEAEEAVKEVCPSCGHAPIKVRKYKNGESLYVHSETEKSGFPHIAGCFVKNK